MAKKHKELKNMSKEEREKKLKELKLELIKSKVDPTKAGGRTREIRKLIARILSLNK